ncbi:fatty acid desaturase family protein [Desertihabitans aurantiacus]|uniref:fatty acid desaturase family protein n=1 Tax=Desertihabitans aurantiacus TaxID=2282477 RepID=UPI000DF82E71|nr:fatty acid desaturase [Desertihabitans aurantiacus]
MSTHAERVAAAADFDAARAIRLLSDLMTPRMAVYWTDLCLSALVGWSAFAAVVVLTPGTPWAALLLGVAVVAMYRATLFIHELVHFRQREHRSRFGLGWNLLVGFWLLIPYFMYEGHSEHHSRRLYGTAGDAEYVAFARMSRSEMVKMALSALVLPLFGPVRFGVLAPVSWLVPRTREWVYARASTIKIDVEYRGHPPKPSQRTRWLVQEAVCFVLVWAVLALVLTGVLSPVVLLWWLALMVGVAGLDTARLLGAHRYLGNDSEANLVLQMIDTINYPRSRVAGLVWGPVGLRLHALHHLVPSLPYHAYREAHQRLLTQLPAGSAYHLTESPGLLHSIGELWRAPRPADRAEPAATRHAEPRG